MANLFIQKNAWGKDVYCKTTGHVTKYIITINFTGFFLSF